MHLRRIAVCLALILASTLPALCSAEPSAPAVAAATYESRLAEARRLATEGSWALARDGYADALKLAPDAEARRWCELWLADSAWRSEKQPDWRGQNGWLKGHLSVLNAILQPYAEGKPRDEFWVAAILSRADFRRVNENDGWDDRFELADYFAAMSPSPQAAKRFVGYLQEFSTVIRSSVFNQLDQSRLLAHLRTGARVGATADDRAWCLLEIAKQASDNGRLSVEERDKFWRDAGSAAQGTLWEPEARVTNLLWEIRRGSRDKQPAGARPDIPAELATIEALHAELKPLAGDKADQSLKALDLLEKALSKPQLEINVPAQVLPGDFVRFSYGAANVESLHATLVRHSPAEHVATQARGATAAPKNREVMRDWTIQLNDRRRGAWNADVAEVSAGLPPGFYTLAVESTAGSSADSRSAEIVVSDIEGMAFSSVSGESDVFVSSRGGEKDIADAVVHGVIAVEGMSLLSFETRTDHEGRFHVPALGDDVKFRREATIAALVGGQPVEFALIVLPKFWHEERFILDAIFDRPLYRPGETVHWKFIARERRDGRFVVPAQTAGLFLAAKSDNFPLSAPVPIKFNAFGTAHGDIVIPASAKPGDVEFTIATGNGEKAEIVGWFDPAFRVDRYVSPTLEAKVELASGPDSLRFSRDITIRTKASYLSGGPVVGAAVEWRIQADSPPERNSSEKQAKFDAWRDALDRETRQGHTDAMGIAECHLQVPPEVAESVSLDIRARVIPESAAEVTARCWCSVTASGLFLDLGEWREPRLVDPDSDLTVTGRILDGTNEPAAMVTGEARLVEKRWTEVWLDPHGAIVTGIDRLRACSKAAGTTEPEKTGWRKLHGGYEEAVVATRSIETGPDGRFIANFKIPREGVFQVQVFHEGAIVPAGERDLTIGATVFAADKKTRTLLLPPEQGFVAAPASVRPGQPFDVLAVVPEGFGTGWVDVCGEDSVLVQRLAPQGRVARFTVDKPPSFAGRAEVEIVWSRGGFIGHYRRCQIPCVNDDLDLEVSLVPTKVETRPGGESSVRIRVAGSNGGGRKAELGLTVFDEALAKVVGNDGKIAVPSYRGCAGTVDLRNQRFGGCSAAECQPVSDPRVVQILSTVDTYPAGEADGLVLSPFVVEAGEDSGYTATSTLAGTRVRTALPERPAMPIEGYKADLPIEIRRHFSSTAFWAPEVVTNEKGEATVEFKYPDNLTQWRIEAYAVGEDGNSFGRAATFTRTSLPFQARLQAPRFLVAGDTAQPSALLVNRTDSDLKARAELKASGSVEMMGERSQQAPRQARGLEPACGELAEPGETATALRAGERERQAAPLHTEAIAVPKQGETHTAWTVKAEQPGDATLTLTARAGAEGDAMVTALPVLEDGIQQETAAGGCLADGAQSQAFNLSLPDKYDLARTTVTVQLSPGHLAAVLDALPYLVDYPYGCVEQTMSRFLPAVVVRKTLAGFGLDAAAVERRVLSRESKAEAARREKTAGLGKLDDVVQKSLARLSEARRNGGGFGWWPDAQEGDLWMTAYVAWGLGLARTAGIAVPGELADGTNKALTRILTGEPPAPDLNAWALAALARAKLEEADAKTAGEAFRRGYDARETLSAAGRACLALAAVKFGDDAQRAVLLRNLGNGAERAPSGDLGDTVHWGSTGGYWRAMDGAVESTALTLLALLELDPQHPFVEPAANWLALNRRSADWASTRDTAFAVLALARYVEVRREFAPDAAVEVLVNGQLVRSLNFTRESLLDGPVAIALEGAALRPGANRIELRRTSGNTPVFAVALASSWAASDGVKPAGNLVAVDRGFVRERAQATLMGTLKITPEPMADGGAAAAGEQVMANVTLYVTNELEYVMVEVPKPAGCEPLNPLSGWDARIRRVEDGGGSTATISSAEASKRFSSLGSAGASPSNEGSPDEGRPIYREERDDKSVFFLDRIEAGTWEIRFGMRATTPGDYRALPVQASAMYVPEVRANSDARRVKIDARDQETPSPESATKQ